jgi:hypothetical protein
MGFLGILEDKHLAHVPATVVLSEDQNPLTVPEGTVASAALKRGTGRDADVILIPQPYVFPRERMPAHSLRDIVDAT